ncbi:AbrB family transcriptional regulator [Mycobacterium vicinigordonae]|uniref:AbrB family transcriptional regulator n=1 Tax=Mycobacterium vicinigordonae TaxID=1719132 RepID=A0A7D6I2H4_9MYCO|nr:AbrB family transcriptional regulator [Mycobacterium vicinigordonae]QLL05378.1 AbrB family transcriptional regulator [Mycobacterium vicinigordonae]
MNTIELGIVGVVVGTFAWLLARYAPKAVPGAGLAAQGVLGVCTGLLVQNISFTALGSQWPIVVAVAVGTLLISVAGGALLGMHRDVSPLTGGLSLVAGGSSGLVSIARELGGDDRVVAAVQYLRVALITAAMPLVATVFFHSAGGSEAQSGETSSIAWYFELPLIAVIVVVGTVAGRRVRLPGAGLLGPMAITIVLGFSGLTAGFTVPIMLVQGASILIVWQTVLDFDRASLRAIRRILPGAFGLIMVLNVISAGMGVLLAKVAGLSMLDGYLATSPGGIYAVLGTAAGSGSNVTFVMATQVIRVVMMLFAAPFIARVFLRFTPQQPQEAAFVTPSRELVAA